MARFLPEVTHAAFRGKSPIFEFTNADGQARWQEYNCGQAAAATFLTLHGVVAPPAADQLMAQLERDHPPDNLAGYFGTSRRRVERMLRAFDLKPVEIDGEDELRGSLDEGNPVIVMLGVPGPRVLGVTMPSGHWMVAYGYDDEQVFLTNWGGATMTWEEFRAGWKAMVPWLINMRRKGIGVNQTLPVPADAV
jgi:hypothetical protein